MCFDCNLFFRRQKIKSILIKTKPSTMACSLNIFSCIEDINRVVSLLADSKPQGEKQDEDEKIESNPGDEWNTDNWTWMEESDNQVFSPLWLQDCCISLSPANDSLAIARDDKAVFFTAKWDKHANNKPHNKYEIAWSGTLAVEDGECVTDILCIPLASQHRSSQGSPDWTCIIAGFTSGYMRIFLQNGSLIFSQLLHEDPVIRLKCRTWEPHRDYGNAEEIEELAILYPNSLVIIDGFSIYQSLRACRNQLARAQASGHMDHTQPPPLAYKKWRFDGQKVIADVASCGVLTQNLFDQLQTASFIGGYNAVIRGAAPAMSQYVTSGYEPFLAVYSAMEGSSPPLISDVAIAVASKLTSAVLSRLSVAGGWLGWGSNPSQTSEQTKPAKPKVEKGTKLTARYGLPDFRRHGNSINLAPNGKLAVTTDEFGRILLLDIKKGIAVRMWKGYRDAECGWVIVDEDHDHVIESGNSPAQHVRRTALFLVIYAAKRGILEIWLTEQGPRIAAFKVGKDCRLLYAGHGILGLAHVHRQAQSPPQHTLNCTLIHGDGTLKTFSVPFHTALSDKHSRRIRDLHLLKKLSSFLETVKCDQEDGNQVVEDAENQLQDILMDIQTPQLQRRGLQCVLATVGLAGLTMVNAVNTVIENINKQGNLTLDDEDDEHNDVEGLSRYCTMQKNLLQAHGSIQELSHDHDDVLEDTATHKNQELAVAQLLGITKSEAVELLTSLSKYHTSQPKQPFKQPTKPSTQSFSTHNMAVTTFLRCFESAADQHSLPSSSHDRQEASGSGTANEMEFVNIRKGLSTEMHLKLANFMFKSALMNPSQTECLRLPLDSSAIHPVHLMDMLVTLWLSSDDSLFNQVDTMFPLHAIVSIISSLAGTELLGDLESKTDDSSVSPWWEHVRHSLAQSTSVARALSLATVCRSVALGMSTAAKKVQSEEKEEESVALAVGDWVSISVEIERWNLLIYQLNDLIALKMFIDRLPVTLGQESRTCSVNCKESDSDHVELSVLGFLSAGTGAASSVLARFLVLYDVPPERLGQPRRLGPITMETPEGEVGDDDRPEEVDVEVTDENQLEGLGELRSKFPNSLHQDILWASCAFECAVQWSAEKERINKLRLAVEHIQCIHCLGLKHGISVLLWKKYFKEKISAAVLLMEKVGKAPKDRLCRKAIDVSYFSLVEFLKEVKRILELLSQINIADAEVLVLRTEDFWHTGDSIRRTIIEEALDQPTSNVPLTELHIILVTIMWIIMGLDMKSVRPLSLFNTTTKGAFLKELSTSPQLSTSSVDDGITQARLKFLTHALSMYITSISSKPEDSFESHAHQSKSVDDWPTSILWVGNELEMDVDCLRHHYVYELYSAGMDSLGSEALLSVRDKQTIGTRLLSIVGQRLACTLNKSESTKSVNQLSRLPTNISRWIKHQDSSKLACRNVPLHQTQDLLGNILTLIPRDSADFALATSLSDAFRSLIS